MLDPILMVEETSWFLLFAVVLLVCWSSLHFFVVEQSFLWCYPWNRVYLYSKLALRSLTTVSLVNP